MQSIKFLKSLHLPKNRTLYNMFVAEGIKTVSDIISQGYHPVELLYCDDPQVPDPIKRSGEQVPYSTLERVSCMKTPPSVFAVFKKFGDEFAHVSDEMLLMMSKDHILFLDNISDPGNFGTIIRTADWFGFHNIVCSNNTVEMYNPKVVQATMGALANVNIVYVNTPDFLDICKNNCMPICGTYMNGSNINTMTFAEKSVFVIGNEANGISSDVSEYITEKISISSYGSKVSESLNAAIAGAIVMYRLRQ